MNRTIEAILKLSAKLGSMAAFGQMSARLAAVDKQAKAFNRTQGLMARGSMMAGAAMSRYLAPAAIAYGAVATARSFATVERRMERIGITADASATETRAALETIRQTAQDIGAPVDNVTEGLENLVASGKSMGEALALLPSVSRTAQAADAEFGQIATTADAVSGSFGIAAEQMDRAFDILAKGGKLGKFELKDMAAELPSLAPAFAALGYSGEAGLKKLTAALQTVRLETGQSGEAATAFTDVLTKMESTATAANFKKFGVDIRKEMSKARKEGKDTLDTFIDLSTKAVKGDLSKLPQLFTDKQMLVGMRALINHTGELKGYFDELGNASGTVARDIDRLTKGAETSFTRIGNSWEKLKQSIGEGLVDAGAAEALNGIAGGVDRSVASKRGLESMGVHGELAQMWWMMNATEDQRRGALWRGGYKSPAEAAAVDAYGAYATSRGAAPDRPVGFVPAPTPRPDRFSRAGRTKDDAIIAPRVIRGSGQSAADAEFEAMRNAPLGAPAFTDLGKVTQALADGGDQAAQKIAAGADQAGQAVQSGVTTGGDQAAQRMQAAIAAGGEQAAGAIARAVASATASLNAAVARSRQASGNPGNSSEGAGVAQ